jgi:hypothetical protein
MNQAVAREGEVSLVGFAFEFGEHGDRLSELYGDARVGSG